MLVGLFQQLNMKIANLIAPYLSTHKKVEIQGLGRIILSGETMESSEESISFPEGSLSFEPDPRTGVNQDLVEYLVEKSGKLRSLVISDLDSFIQLGIQFINLGKPFEIPGVGHIRKAGNGRLEFVQGPSVHTKIEIREQPKTQMDEASQKISFRSEKKKVSASRKYITIFAMILAACLIVYLLLMTKEPAGEDSLQKVQSENENPADKKPSEIVSIQSKDSLPENIDSVGTNAARGFRVIVKEYSSFSRATNFKRLLEKNHELVVFTKDSTLFKVAIPFDLPVQDSSRVRDSIKKLLGLPVYIEIP